MWRQGNRWLAPILIAVLLYPLSASPQLISGAVLDSEGKPLAGVEVYGIRESCCPSSVPWTSTGANGKYVLKNAGSILHFRRIDLKPLSLRTEGARTLNATMKPNESPMIVPACEEHGIGRFGDFLRFKPSPKRLTQSIRDVDYESYRFRAEDGGSLESWFGPTAANIDAFKERYIKSREFSERAVFVPTLAVIGIDASGTYFNGRRWRWIGTDPHIPKAAASTEKPPFTWHLSISTNGIGYNNASVDDQKEFDTVIDSACVRDPQMR
jgi:hypothetical protein